MKITTINYHKVFNLGGYENEKISLEATLEEGENHVEAFAKLKDEVQKSHDFSKDIPKYRRANEVLADPMNYTGYDVENAKKIINLFEEKYPDHIAAFKNQKGLVAIPENSDSDDLPY